MLASQSRPLLGPILTRDRQTEEAILKDQPHASPSYPLSLLLPMPVETAREILEGVYAFAPNRETLGGTAYAIAAPSGLILVDCPPPNETTQEFLQALGGVKWLCLTHRSALSGAERLQASFDCEILIQEQEAYLLPESRLTPFRDEFMVSEHCQAVWTCGHSPGSACLYARLPAADGTERGILFSGRHLLPDTKGNLTPLRTAKTFHWPRQLRAVAALRDRFDRQTLQFICPGANTGFLRGQGYVSDAWEQLQHLDLDALSRAKIGL